MDLGTHLGSIWRSKWVALAIALLAAALVFLVSSQRPDRFRAETVLSVQISANSSDRQLQAEFAAGTFTALADTRAVREDAASLADGPRTADDFKAHSSVAVGASPSLLVVAGTGGRADSADYALSLATALVVRVSGDNTEALAEDVAPLQQQLDRVAGQLTRTPPGPAADALRAQYNGLAAAIANRRAQTPTRLSFLTAPPQVSVAKTGPRPAKDAAFAFILAVVVAAEALVGLRRLRGKLSAGAPASDALAVTGLPVLAEISARGAAGTRGDAEAARAWASLAHRLGDARCLVVVGCGDRQVASVVALQFALTVDRLGRPSILVDAGAERGGHRARPSHSGPTDLAARLAGVRRDCQQRGRQITVRLVRADYASTLLVPSSAPEDAGDDRRRADDVMILAGPTAEHFDDTFALLQRFPYPVVLAVDELRVTRRALLSATRSLAASRAEPLGLVLLRRRRFPRLPNHRVPMPMPRPSASTPGDPAQRIVGSPSA